MHIPEDTIQEIRRRADLVAQVESTLGIKLKKGKKAFVGDHPQGGRIEVWDGKDGCMVATHFAGPGPHQSWDIFKWLEEFHGLKFIDAAKQVARDAGIILPESAPVKVGKGRRKAAERTENVPEPMANAAESVQAQSEVASTSTEAPPSPAASAPEPPPEEPGGPSWVETAVEDWEAPFEEPETDRKNVPGHPVIRAFLDSRSLVLTDADFRTLREKRGLSAETCRALKFRSSQNYNRDILLDLQMRVDSGEDAWKGESLRQTGLFDRDEKGLKPNAQYFGWGMTGRKDPKTGRSEFAWTNPVLIPYFSPFDAAGVPWPDDEVKLLKIRPHKGGASGQPVEIYCPDPIGTRRMVEAHHGLLVICESEFKAAALYECGIPAIGLQGIHNINNLRVRRWLLGDYIHADPERVDRVWGWIPWLKATDVVVVFDNEEKGDPKLPGYKPRPQDRYQSIVQSMWTVRVLREPGPRLKKVWHPRFAVLKNEWRNEAGKADWDGVLAMLLTKGTLRDATKEFKALLRQPFVDHDELEFYPTMERRVIRNQLARRLYKRALPIGKDRDLLPLVDRYRKVDHQLSNAFESVIGVHYRHKPVTKETRKEWEKVLQDYATLKDMPLDSLEGEMRDKRLKWECARYRLEHGIPEKVCDFAMTCNYRLMSSDGKLKYLVSARNRYGEKTMQLRLNPEQIASPSDFKAFCLERLGSSFSGDVKSLNALMEDLVAMSAHQVINEIVAYGYDEKTGLWVMGDNVITEDGDRVFADENGVFWVGSNGYQIDEDPSRIGEGVMGGAPLLGKETLNPELAAEALWALNHHLLQAIGDNGSMLSIGLVMSYAIHPELSKKGGAPGIWFIGRKGSGKTTLQRWLVRTWGFGDQPPAGLGQGATGVGVQRALARMSCLPLPFDEYRQGQTRPEVEGALRNAFNRIVDPKGVMDNSLKTRGVAARTTPFASGENAMPDPATRSRYLHMTIMKDKRLPDEDPHKRYVEMEQRCATFNQLGLWLLMNRKAFAEKAMAAWDAWMTDTAVAKCIADDRQRLVMGAAYCSWSTAMEMLAPYARKDGYGNRDSFDAQLMMVTSGKLKEFALEFAQQEVEDGAEVSSMAMQFWSDLLTFIQRKLIPIEFFAVRYCKLSRTAEGRLIGRVDGKNTKEAMSAMDKRHAEKDGYSAVIVMSASAVFGAYERQYRQDKGDSPKMSKQDLFREFRTEKFWVVSDAKHGSHQLWMGKTKASCWAFEVMSHPRGEELQDAIEAQSWSEDALDARRIEEGKALAEPYQDGSNDDISLAG